MGDLGLGQSLGIAKRAALPPRAVSKEAREDFCCCTMDGEKAAREKTWTGATGERESGLGDSTVHANVNCIPIQREVNKAMPAEGKANAKCCMCANVHDGEAISHLTLNCIHVMAYSQ